MSHHSRQMEHDYLSDNNRLDIGAALNADNVRIGTEAAMNADNVRIDTGATMNAENIRIVKRAATSADNNADNNSRRSPFRGLFSTSAARWRSSSVAAAIAVAASLALATVACDTGGAGSPEVVIYTSVDRNFSEPVLDAFETEHGISVQAVYDVEAAKTTGLVNRLLAERERPQADVWWNGEFAQTITLADEGVLAPYDSTSAEGLPPHYVDANSLWAAFGGRARVLLVNTDLMPEGYMPDSVGDLADSPVPPEQIGIAHPLFGTTATHVAALYALNGAEPTLAFFKMLAEQGVQVVDGNSVVRDMVVDGRLAFGLTDTDDACGALERDPDAPLEIVFPDQGPNEPGTLVIPNTIGLVAGGPNPESGQALIDYLLGEQAIGALVESGWFQVTLRDVGVVPPCADSSQVKTFEVGLAEIAAQMEVSKADMGSVFMQ